MHKCWLLLAILTITLSSSAFSQSGVYLDAGDVKGYYTSVSDLGSESEVVEHVIVGTGDTQVVRKIPGRLKFLNVTLRRALAKDKAAWDWRKLVANGDIQGARRGVTIQLLDDASNPVATWTLENCWPSSLTLETIDGVLVEQLVLACEGIVRTL